MRQYVYRLALLTTLALLSLFGCGAHTAIESDPDATPGYVSLPAVGVAGLFAPDGAEIEAVRVSEYDASISLEGYDQHGTPVYYGLVVNGDITLDFDGYCNAAIDRFGAVALTSCTPPRLNTNDSVGAAATGFIFGGRTFILYVYRDGREIPMDLLRDLVSGLTLVTERRSH